jgi:hypothetical protein
MRLESRGLLALAVALTISSCDVEPGSEAPSGTLSPADREIAAQLYSGTSRTPPGFLDDAAPAGFAQVTTYHVKTTQLAAPAAASYEVCTDDWSQAFAWSEEVALASSPYLDFVGNEATARYYEFDRVPQGQPDRYVRMRVFRCSYLDRTGVDMAAAAGFAGVLNVRPLDAAALRELGEYLWWFTIYNNADHAVLASEPGSAVELAHVLTIASLERAAGGTSCDRITVRESTLSADPLTGVLQRATVVVRELGVRQEGALLVGC